MGPSQMPGIRPMVEVSPSNMRVRANPKITAADVSFDLQATPLNRNMVPTFERMANEMAILINNLYKRRELDEVNVRSLIRIRFYLAFIYRKTQQPKLRARIEEAVREINEELRHRLDFEERYKSGLIKRVDAPSTSTMGTQKDMPLALPPSVSSETIGPEGLNPSMVSNLRNAAARARAKVAERRAGGVGVAQQLPPQGDPSQLSSRAQALLQLVTNGKIDVSELTQTDYDSIAPYLSTQRRTRPIKVIIPPPSPPSFSPVKKMTALPAPLKAAVASPPAPSSASSMMAVQGGQTGAATPDAASLKARAQALLALVKSGKLQIGELAPKDRNLLQQYVNQSVSTGLSQLPPLPPEMLAEPL